MHHSAMCRRSRNVQTSRIQYRPCCCVVQHAVLLANTKACSTHLTFMPPNLIDCCAAPHTGQKTGAIGWLSATNCSNLVGQPSFSTTRSNVDDWQPRPQDCESGRASGAQCPDLQRNLLSIHGRCFKTCWGQRIYAKGTCMLIFVCSPSLQACSPQRLSPSYTSRAAAAAAAYRCYPGWQTPSRHMTLGRQSPLPPHRRRCLAMCRYGRPA